MRILTDDERLEAANCYDLEITASGPGRYRLRFRVLDARAYGLGGAMPGAPDDPFERWLDPGVDMTIGEMYEHLVEYQADHGPRDFNFYFGEAPDFVVSAFHRIVDELEADQARWLAMNGHAR